MMQQQPASLVDQSVTSSIGNGHAKKEAPGPFLNLRSGVGNGQQKISCALPPKQKATASQPAKKFHRPPPGGSEPDPAKFHRTGRLDEQTSEFLFVLARDN